MRLVSADLSNPTITKMITALKTDVDDCTALIIALDDFVKIIEINQSLSGASYIAIKERLNEYKKLLSIRKQSAMSLLTAINSAISQMSNYIEPYTELDDTEIATLKQSIKNAIEEANRLEIAITDGNIFEDTSGCIAKISELHNEATYLQKQIEKIENLVLTDNFVFTKITNIEDSLTKYRSSINKMSPIQVNTTI